MVLVERQRYLRHDRFAGLAVLLHADERLRFRVLQVLLNDFHVVLLLRRRIDIADIRFAFTSDTASS